MRLSSILLVVSAVTFIVSGSAANAGQATKVSKMTSENVDLLDVSLNNDETKRFLRSHEGDEDEERLSGANMFNIEKLDDALNNTNYANTLFGRWKHHGFDVDKVTKRFSKEGYQIDANAKSLINAYETYIKANSALQTDAKLFARGDVYKAFNDVAYADDLYKVWKQNGLTSDDVINHFYKTRLNEDDKYYRVYGGYVTWLNIHHQLEKTVKTTPKEFLFSASRIARAQKDEVFAEKLFAKWEANRLRPRTIKEKLQTMDLAGDKLYDDYVKWLRLLPAKSTR